MLARLVTTSEDAGAKVRVLGEIDLSNASEIRSSLVAIMDQHLRVALHLGDCRYFDSSGVALVHELRAYARTAGKTLEFVAPAGSYAHRVLALSGLMGGRSAS